MSNLGTQENIRVKTVGILREYLSKLENVQFNEDFLRWVFPEIPRVAPPFSGQISTLTLTEHTPGSKIRAERGKRLTFFLKEFVAILYFLAQECQKGGENGPLLNNYNPNIFRVRIDKGEGGYIIPIVVRRDRRLHSWSVFYTRGMEFDDLMLNPQARVFSPE